MSAPAEFRVRPSKTSEAESVYVEITTELAQFRGIYLTREEADELGTKLLTAVEWLMRTKTL